jgi:L-ascorbate metabolism protein UlaG (beta-lactamase superfamily)
VTTAAVTWLGHATTLIELDRVRVLTDPVLGKRVGPLVRIAEPVEPAAVHAVDCVLLSHLHADHVDLRSLRRVAAGVPVFGPPGAARWLAGNGVPNARELAPGDIARVGELQIEATPAVHDSRRRPLGPRATPVGYLARGSRCAYFAGDTDLFDEMSALRGLVDVALLPIWGWGPTLGPGHLDPERAARAAAMIAPQIAIPIHWGTFALGPPARRPEDPRRPVRAFAALAKRYAPAVQVRVLEPGERLTL